MSVASPHGAEDLGNAIGDYPGRGLAGLAASEVTICSSNQLLHQTQPVNVLAGLFMLPDSRVG